MRPYAVERVSQLKGTLTFLGDKSIAHRALFLSSLTNSNTTIKNFPANKDCLETVRILKNLGIKIKLNAGTKIASGATAKVFGKGLYGLRQPKKALFVKESGTTFRLILGILAGHDFKTKISAGRSLSLRPMLRVTKPLRLMGARICARTTNHEPRTTNHEEYPPITIQGGNLNPVTYRMPQASAQVKSAILLAGLFAKGRTKVIEPIKTRDHTERMLKAFKAHIKVKKNTIIINGCRQLISPGKFFVPSDISSAAFFICLAAISKRAQIRIKDVSLNPTRTGLIRVLKRMKADIKVIKRPGLQYTAGEPMGDLIVRNSLLTGARVKKKEVPGLIDELPVLMVTACFARGKTVLENVNELRVKETDRIRSMTENLRKMGAKIKLLREKGRENIIITGVKQLKAAKVRSFSDHRTAMSMVIAGMCSKGRTEIDDIACIAKSFPSFLTVLDTLHY